MSSRNKIRAAFCTAMKKEHYSSGKYLIRKWCVYIILESLCKAQCVIKGDSSLIIGLYGIETRRLYHLEAAHCDGLMIKFNGCWRVGRVRGHRQGPFGRIICCASSAPEKYDVIPRLDAEWLEEQRSVA